MSKLRALVTAEVIKDSLEKKYSRIIDFDYAGYNINHEVMPHEELISLISNYEILICEYDTISADVFEAAKNLKIIICCRGGVKTVIDLDKAKEKDIIVCNNAGRNAGSVTDMVMGYILAMTRNINLSNQLIHSKSITADFSTKPEEYRDTVWGLDNNSPFIKFRGRSINHMSIGIIGYGHAGRLLAQKANAFGMEIFVTSPHIDRYVLPDYVTSSDFNSILHKCDIISVHCSLNTETRNMFSKREFNEMKDGAFFINTARGELVVEEDLVEALKSGKLAGAAIDVTRVEPISSDSMLIGVPNLIITPHIAGSADDVQYTGTSMIIESLDDFLIGNKPSNCVVYY